jgi:P-type E1-E2 ATPase
VFYLECVLYLECVFYRLQESVPSTMRVLGEAGVRVWMVTGDKVSTAKQVAV